jgi:hypothetical protein
VKDKKGGKSRGRYRHFFYVTEVNTKYSMNVLFFKADEECIKGARAIIKNDELNNKKRLVKHTLHFV